MAADRPRLEGAVPLFSRAAIHSLLVRFAQSRRGNVAVIFAIACIPVIAAMGVAVDYTRAAQTTSEMQDALDAASLALSRQPTLSTMTSAQIQKFAKDYFAANFKNDELQNLTLNASFTPTGPSVTISATGKLPTDFMGIIGTKDVPIGRSSTTIWGEAKLRVALALDTTGSMSSSGKITALKTATKNLLTQLKGAASVNGDVYVSIIPFARNVNAGPSKYNESWIDWTDWEAEPSFTKPSNWAQIGPGSSCPFPSSWWSSTYGFTCMDRPATASGAQSASSIPSSGTYAGYICPSKDDGSVSSIKSGIYYNGCYDSQPTVTTSTSQVCSGKRCSCGSLSNCSCTGSGKQKVCTQTITTTGAPYTHTWRPANTAAAPAHSTWNGCMADRGTSSGPSTGNYDQTNTAPDTSNTDTLFPAQQYASCPSAMTPLTYNWDALDDAVDDLTPNGSTNQPIGLQWAWQSLTAAPFTIPAMDPSKVYKQVIILLTDGLNTQDRWYGDGYNTSTQVNARQTPLCDNVKAAGITLYTVQVNTGGDPTSTLLQNCASSSDKFFLLTDADQMVTTFQQIGTELSELRISE